MGMEIMKFIFTRWSAAVTGGLSLICLYLLCNWWLLSSENSELVKQLDNLSEQLRINGDELNKCIQQKSLLDDKLKESQSNYVQLQTKVEQTKESENEINKG